VPHVVPPLAQPEGFPVVANHMVGERIAPPMAVVPLGFEGEDELGVVPFLLLEDQGDRFSDRDDVNLTPRASGLRQGCRAATPSSCTFSSLKLGVFHHRATCGSLVRQNIWIRRLRLRLRLRPLLLRLLDWLLRCGFWIGSRAAVWTVSWIGTDLLSLSPRRGLDA